MNIAVRPYATAGVALVVSSAIAVAPVAPVLPSPDLNVTNLEVRLASGFDPGSLANIPVNLFNDIANIPYDLYEAPYSVAGLVPQFAAPGQDVIPGFDYPAIPTSQDVSADPLSSDGVSNGALNNLANALFYTGSWWKSSPTNVWGWDTGNPWNFTALINVLVPVQPMGEPLGDNLNTYLAAEFPPAQPANKFLFNDLLGELETLFKIPTSQLVAGFTFGTGVPLTNPPVINPVGIGADPLGNGGTTYPEIWNGTTQHLDPNFGLGTGQTQTWNGDEVNNFLTGLMEDPSDNPIHTVNPKDIIPTLWNVYNSFNTDFSPVYLGANPATGELVPSTDSFAFQSAQVVYGIPALINGIYSGAHGLCPGCGPLIPNSLTDAVGGVLNSLFGPNSAFATGVIAASDANMELLNKIELATGGPGVPGFLDSAPDLSTPLPDLSADLSQLF